MANEASLLLSLTRKFVLTFLVTLAAVLVLVVLGARSWINKNTAVFTASASPQNIYKVNLKGAKGRPFLLPYLVSADVYKMGQPYVADVWLHEAWDAFDTSFEIGFPDISWPANNIIEFHSPEEYKDGNDTIIVQNRSGKPLRCLFVDAVHLFLVIDIRPGASQSLKVPKSNGDWQWFSFEGVLDDGTKIPRTFQEFNRRHTRGVNCTYMLSILESGAAIETRMPGCQ